MKQVLTSTLAAALLFLVIAPFVHAQGKTSTVKITSHYPAARTLVRKLQRGGYVVYIRHGERAAFKEPDLPDMNDCKTQDNLTDKGRRQSVALGAAYKLLKIPVGEVYSGEFCRNKESAMLAFGKDTVLPELDRFNPNVLPAIRKLLSTAPATGSNTIIVNHHQALADASKAKLIDYAESAVFLPDGKGGFQLQGYIKLDELNALRRKR
ncbi:MAG: hypothetical protein ABR577_09430 [Pyrinomonadaceae bacterium]